MLSQQLLVVSIPSLIKTSIFAALANYKSDTSHEVA